MTAPSVWLVNFRTAYLDAAARLAALPRQAVALLLPVLLRRAHLLRVTLRAVRALAAVSDAVAVEPPPPLP
jgi:hypothetical protein